MTRIESELLGVRREVVRMGSLVVDIAVAAAQALARVDVAAAREVIRDDELIDTLRFQLDERLVQAIALNHPMGEDLRSIAAAIRICCDLERIGDNAVNIAKSVIRLGDEPRAWVHPSLKEMGELCVDMIEEAMEAYFSRDVDAARVISKQDDNIDAYYKEIEQYFTTPRSVPASACIQNVLISRAFERMADHATNICEWSMYESTGIHEELN